ncbi:MAG: diguanylate cyclase [Proteobacteria bacterium]|nr:diguanylate cyclase [Pseudomonadota bacterium]
MTLHRPGSAALRPATAAEALDALPEAVLAVDDAGQVQLANRAAGRLFGCDAGALIGAPVRRVLPAWPELLEVWRPTDPSAAPEDAGAVELPGLRCDGATVALEVLPSRLPAGATELTLVLLRDVGARKRREQRRTRETARLAAVNTELSVLYEVTAAMAHSLDLAETLPAVLRTITQLRALPVEPRGALFLLEGLRLRLAAQVGYEEEFLQQHREIGVGECLCGRVAAAGEPLLSASSAHDARHSIFCAGLGDHGHIVVPLKAQQRVVGVLCLHLAVDTSLDDLAVRALVTAGHHIGVAIEHARLYEGARQRALHDSLTGLANRRLMEVLLERSLAQARRAGTALSLVMIDVDHFKRFNDTHGHSAGDEVLRQLAAAITASVRDADLAARYGGEEFLLLLPDAGLDEAAEAAERVRAAVAVSTPVTISLGVACYQEAMGGVQALLDAADAAMYRAKRSGRNRVELAPPPLPRD